MCRTEGRAERRCLSTVPTTFPNKFRVWDVLEDADLELLRSSCNEGEREKEREVGILNVFEKQCISVLKKIIN